MKKHFRNLLLICTTTIAGLAHNSAAYADSCPSEIIVDSPMIEITPSLDCLEVELRTGCQSATLDIRNLCDSPVTLTQIQPTCLSIDKTSIPCRQHEIPIADSSDRFINREFYSYFGVGEQEILFDATHNGDPYEVKIEYSATEAIYEDGCSVSSKGNSSPSTPFSILTALAIVAMIGHRRRK